MDNPLSHANKVKAGCAVITSACFAWGIRAAWKQAKPLKPNELTNSKLMGGVGFASRTLGIATVLTVSGFGLLVLGISAALNVNTPKQFGTRVTSFFGDSLRINRNAGPAGSDNLGENYETLSELFEAANKTSKKQKASIEDSSQNNRKSE
ncbi:hypothetical protein M3Y97_00672100 [Aphelenchoides bicaudatus]|nr:hypothetical protein M3Y97_00672100 [Aphelenchoides bicaudatus]